MLYLIFPCKSPFVQERSRVLFRFADLIEKHNDEIAALETWDNGKPFEQSAKIEIPMVARFFRYYAGMAIFYAQLHVMLFSISTIIMI